MPKIRRNYHHKPMLTLSAEQQAEQARSILIAFMMVHDTMDFTAHKMDEFVEWKVNQEPEVYPDGINWDTATFNMKEAHNMIVTIIEKMSGKKVSDIN